MATIGVIDYGMGNLHSISKALQYVSDGETIEVSYDPDLLAKADRLVLPGVGAIRDCMDELQRLELDQLIKEAAGSKPMLGICLGIEAMMSRSDESGGVDALDLFPGEVLRFPEPEPGVAGRLKVPHMGWNQVKQTREHPLWKNIPDGSWYYFVHSYYVDARDEEQVLGSTEYGLRFASVLLRENLLAVQFHPEKSQTAGLTLMANFLQWDGSV